MSVAQLPAEGPLASLDGEAEVLASGASPRRPWVVATGDRVLKAYDLSHFDATDRARLMAEAETALALSDLDGVVTTNGFELEDGWLVIEMERLGETLAGYLKGVAAGTRPALEPARWGALFETVARTLGEVHRRRRLHRDVKPENLIFDRSGERLLVADFSVAMRRPRLGAREGSGGLAGTRRYIAPEVMRGRVGPAADQYGLGVTAGDALGEAAPPAAKPVLLRATEQSPEDRYGSIADFGLALRSALDETAPRRLSSRLQRVSVKWRQAWGIGGVVFAATYAWLLWKRPPSLDREDGLVLPLLAAAVAMAIARMLDRFRGGRSQPRLPIANRSWFPVLLCALAIAALSPLLVDNPSNAGKTVFFVAVGAVALSAGLGSVRREAGERLITLVRRWERWREAHRRRPAPWWGLRLVALAGLALLTVLPSVLADRWPGASGGAPADGAPIAIVAQLRAAMLDGQRQEACALARVPAEPGKVSCPQWVRLAGEWTRDDVRSGSPAFVPGQLGEMRLTETVPLREPLWRIRERRGEGRDLGMLAREDPDGRVWEVTVIRHPPTGDPVSELDEVWRYEVVEKARRWWITSVEACNFNASPACVRVTQLDRSELPKMVRQGPPGSA
jgi:tRNA A-37 threonylcarbamoyl transferase component Bud32